MVPVAAMWDRLVKSAIVVETPLFAVSWMGATHSHLRMMESPRCWCSTAYNNCKDHDTHSDHDNHCTPASTYCLPRYDSASPDTTGRCSQLMLELLCLPAIMGHAPVRLTTVDHEVLPTHVGVIHPAPAYCYKSAGSTPCTLGSLHCEQQYGSHC